MQSIPSSSKDTALAFIAARLSGRSISRYPGVVPQSLSDAYKIQDEAIRLWPQEVSGWKVGGISEPDIKRFKEFKLAGPVFSNQIYWSDGSQLDMPVFADGFAAIEGEIVIVVKSNAPSRKFDWSRKEALELVGSVHIGVEIASSPFSRINEMGPGVTISDFGNNNGLIIGQILPQWSDFNVDDWEVETIIDNVTVGKANAIDPLISFQFILENAARRDMPLKKGMAITTGAITGVHRAHIGQMGKIKCKNVDDINVSLVAF